MNVSFNLVNFSNCNLKDPFFDTLKKDYPDFTNWFDAKSRENRTAYVDKDDSGHIHAFMSIKPNLEKETLGVGPILPEKTRLKISTIKIDDTFTGQRLGEGAIGIALWHWKESAAEEIYLTTFEKQDKLIGLLEKYGFKYVSDAKTGERIYLKDKKNLNYSTPEKSFPYVNPNYKKSKYLPINENYHDKMFQRSKLKGVLEKKFELPVSNGITKNYIATPYSTKSFDYETGDLVFVYRKHEGSGAAYHSAVTSFCVVTNITNIKIENRPLKTMSEYRKIIGNKSIYSKKEIEEIYQNNNNVVVIELMYNGYFGEGNNISWAMLKNNGLWDGHPYESHISRENVKKIFELGKINVQDVIVD